MEDPGPRRASEFASTQWSLVLAATELTDPASRTALARLFEAYWFPLYAFARRRRIAAEDAKDAVQAFFAALLEKNGLRTVEPDRGRFRSFLLGAFRHFLANRRDHAAALKRGGGVADLSLDLAGAEARYGREPVDDQAPDRLYERRWALTVVDRGLGRLRRECEAAGKGARFDQLKGFLTGDRGRGNVSEVAQRLEMSDGAVRVAVHRLRRRFGELLRDEIAATVDQRSEVDAEMRHLLRVLRS